MHKRILSNPGRTYKWLAMISIGGCAFQLGGCINDILFLVAPFIL